MCLSASPPPGAARNVTPVADVALGYRDDEAQVVHGELLPSGVPERGVGVVALSSEGALLLGRQQRCAPDSLQVLRGRVAAQRLVRHIVALSGGAVMAHLGHRVWPTGCRSGAAHRRSACGHRRRMTALWMRRGAGVGSHSIALATLLHELNDHVETRTRLLERPARFEMVSSIGIPRTISRWL
jgi:hypothetical protein